MTSLLIPTIVIQYLSSSIGLLKYDLEHVFRVLSDSRESFKYSSQTILVEKAKFSSIKDY